MTHRNYGCRYREFLWRGYRCCTIENEMLRVLMVPDKGADILEFLHKPTDTECLWHSPRGLPMPHFRPSSPLESGHFREYFAGGWYEMLPNGPVPCQHRGAHFGYHGEATLLPWDTAVIEDRPDCVKLRFSVRLVRVPLRVEKTVHLSRGRATLFLHERITNEGRQAVEFLWGHHPTFGAPLLEPGAQILVPRCEAVVAETLPPDARLKSGQRARWPRLRGVNGEMLDVSVIPDLEVRSHDFVRLEHLESGWYALFNPARDVGFALRFDATRFPVLGCWQLFHGGPDYPWYQEHFLTALEPASDLPSLSESVQRGTAVTLGAGEFVETELEATAYRGIREVRSVDPGGEVRP